MIFLVIRRGTNNNLKEVVLFLPVNRISNITDTNGILNALAVLPKDLCNRSTGTRPISEVKPLMAQSVLQRGTLDKFYYKKRLQH
ncbi:uncharacterized protein OCT59_001526 [Rhizophagus irregularis]|uniref:uncharacterized protein n=1 Tax=Rhizophagus irregularis TaxID=588596 RepID=UPI0019F9FFBF|nr:hypothetical protein OCT59_001526 [Rhizophagus irregularis]GET55821.1 hypothetical protein GLOIN_2v1519028 [Rhizophagus irregularis DAOM 181602=DAOM 197198]